MNASITCVDHFGKTHRVTTDSIIFRPSVYGVLREKEQVLMVKAMHVNKWEFPGGGVQPDESMANALKREYQEETGFQVKMGTLISSGEDYFYSEMYKKVWFCMRYLFWVEKTGGSLIKNGNNDDVVEAKYISIDNATQNMMKPKIYSVFKKRLLK